MYLDKIIPWGRSANIEALLALYAWYGLPCMHAQEQASSKIVVLLRGTCAKA